MTQQGLQFDREMALQVESVYKTRDAARRRKAVLDALQVQPGERVIDIGTGPGFIALEMADLVQEGGAILAVDRSEAMLELARARCADKPCVEFHFADATRLPSPDALFDAAVSVQVIEYVPEVQLALKEMYRVLKAGGRAVVISTDWDSIVWHSKNKARMKKILTAFQEHCKHSNLPRVLGALLTQTGFRLEEHQVISQFNPKLDSEAYSQRLIPILKSFVVDRNGVSEDEASAWAEEMQQLSDSGEYFFCLNQFLFLARK